MTSKSDTAIKTEIVIYVFGWAAIVSMAGFLAWYWKNLPPELPWFYSLPWGDQQLMPKWGLVGALGGLSIAYLFNEQVSRWVGGNDSISKRAMLIGGVIVVALFLASFIRVMSIFI